MENLYALLNCNDDASVETIKKSYLELALRYHPDKSGGEGAKFVQINRAWSILGDVDLREEYDRRWRERSLAQTYPIQDEIHFDEFDFVETANSFDEDVDNSVQGPIQLSTDRSDPETASACCNHITNSAGCSVQNDDKVELPEEFNKLDSSRQSGGDNPDCHNEPPGEYHYECRCGGLYVLTQTDVRFKFDIVCCDTCSLSICVLYETD